MAEQTNTAAKVRTSPAAGKVSKHAIDASMSADSVVLQLAGLSGDDQGCNHQCCIELRCLHCLFTDENSVDELLLLLSHVACCIELLIVISTRWVRNQG